MLTHLLAWFAYLVSHSFFEPLVPVCLCKCVGMKPFVCVFIIKWKNFSLSCRYNFFKLDPKAYKIIGGTVYICFTSKFGEINSIQIAKAKSLSAKKFTLVWEWVPAVSLVSRLGKVVSIKAISISISWSSEIWCSDEHTSEGPMLQELCWWLLAESCCWLLSTQCRGQIRAGQEARERERNSVGWEGMLWDWPGRGVTASLPWYIYYLFISYRAECTSS